MIRKRVLLPAVFLAVLALASPASAACVNKYVAQKSGNRLSLTLLTGMLNFEDAKELAEAIENGSHEPLSWIDAEGKVIAKQWGQLKVVRPMPVACGEKTSGVVVLAVFPTINVPKKVVTIRFDPKLTVDFAAQEN